MKIELSKESSKVIERMDKPSRQRLKAAIGKLPEGDVKKLQGPSQSFRLRVGGWRVVFSYVETDKILIDRIGPRGEVYKGV